MRGEVPPLMTRTWFTLAELDATWLDTNSLRPHGCATLSKICFPLHKWYHTNFGNFFTNFGNQLSFLAVKIVHFWQKGWRILDSISLYRESLDSTSLFWELYPSVADFCGENKKFVCFMGSLWLATSLVIEFLNRWDYAAKRTFGVFRPIWRNLCQIWQ